MRWKFPLEEGGTDFQVSSLKASCFWDLSTGRIHALFELEAVEEKKEKEKEKGSYPAMYISQGSETGHTRM